MSINVNAMNKVLSKYLGCNCRITEYDIDVYIPNDITIVVTFISDKNLPVLCKNKRFIFGSCRTCYNSNGTTEFEYNRVDILDIKLKKKLLKAFRQEN